MSPGKRPLLRLPESLNEVGRYASDLDRLVRVEVHGIESQEIPNMKAIFEQVTEDSVKICWNCNDQDLLPPGLEAQFQHALRNGLATRFISEN